MGDHPAGRLSGLVALVTGGGTGIGRAVARRFVEEGARVAIVGRTLERLAGVKVELGEAILPVQGDVSRAEDNARAVAETVAAFGQLDIFVGNAGVFDRFVRLRDIPVAELDRAFDELFSINVKGYLLGARSALEELEKTGGSIVFTGSTSSLAPGYGGALYVPAKHAIAGLTRQLAWELAPTIRVNAVAVGYVPTELGGLRSLDQRGGPSRPEDVLPRIPLGLVPTPDDIAGIYVTLAAPRDNRYLTGSVVLVDGGQTMWGPPH
ncbi:MAG: SDR family oxidoreductase [Chloroflexi bacterium]|nr:SDR family oxidoreductase [Chloroflexota bacterium]MBV9600846.1 SDR family oxidoreductase [Chloroflexota bacterium]